MLDIARAIKASLGEVARKVPTRPMPDWVLRLVAIFDPVARQAVHDLGRWYGFDSSQTRRVLSMDFIPASKAASDMAQSLVRLGLA
jgi:dihydroflavonol-4-reductase